MVIIYCIANKQWLLFIYCFCFGFWGSSQNISLILSQPISVKGETMNEEVTNDPPEVDMVLSHMTQVQLKPATARDIADQLSAVLPTTLTKHYRKV